MADVCIAGSRHAAPHRRLGRSPRLALTSWDSNAPTTLDEFLAVAQAFTEKDPDGNGKADTYGFCGYIDGSGLNNPALGTRFDWVFGAYGVAGTWNLKDSASFGLNVRNPNTLKALQFIKKMADAKVIDPDWPPQERRVPGALEAGQVRHDARKLCCAFHSRELYGL